MTLNDINKELEKIHVNLWMALDEFRKHNVDPQLKKKTERHMQLADDNIVTAIDYLTSLEILAEGQRKDKKYD